MKYLGAGIVMLFIMIIGNMAAAAVYGGHKPIPLWGSFIEGGWLLASLAVCGVGVVQFVRFLRSDR